MAQTRYATWRLAGTHFLTAGFAIPVLVGAAAFVIVTLLRLTDPIFRLSLGFILGLFSTWLGVRYSANYLKNTYKLKEVDFIIFLSTIFLIILSLLRVLLTTTSGETIRVFYELAQVTVVIALFYWLSKKYFKES